MEFLGLTRSTPPRDAIDCRSRRGDSTSWREREPGIVRQPRLPARRWGFRTPHPESSQRILRVERHPMRAAWPASGFNQAGHGGIAGMSALAGALAVFGMV